MASISSTTRVAGQATQVSAEGVVITLTSPDDLSNPSIANLPTYGNTQNYTISGTMNVTAGAGTTAVVIRCRRNTVTGTQVGTSQTVTLAAGTLADLSFDFVDFSANPANQISSYVITLQQTGGTGAGTINECVGRVASFI